MRKSETLPFVDYFNVIIKWRKFIYYEVAIVIIVTLSISLFIPNQYTSTATILPPSPEKEAMFGLLLTNLPSGLAGITGGGGLLGGPTPSDLFASIMRSQKIMDEIIKKYDLEKVFRTKTIYDTYNKLIGMTQIIISPENIISVSVTHEDKYLAANIANSFIEELDRFNTETAMTMGKRYRIFIEERLKETEDTLAKNEQALRDFQEKHRTVALEEEIISAIETIAALKSQIILFEVKKGALSSSSQYTNPYLYDINRELRELKKQLSKIEFGTQDTTKKEFGAGFAVPFSELPKVALEYARLMRDVEVQATIFKLLTQQYEQAKIMELKDTPTVQFLDHAVPAEKKSYPHRGMLLITACVISLLGGVCFSFLLEYREKLKNRPDEYSKWRRIFFELKGDLIYIKQKLPFIRKL